MNSVINLSKLLTVISKGLNIANKTIPLYKDYKPLFQNINKVFNLINEENEEKKIINTPEKKEPLKRSSSNTSPQFFM